MGRFQGRGRSSGRGTRGGRSSRGGRGHSSSNLGRSNNSATKTKLEEHIYRVGSASQASDYVTITRSIVSHIKEKYTKGGTAEIAWALENEKEYDFTPLKLELQIVQPTGEGGTSTYPEKMLQKQYEMDYSQDLKTYTDKVETYMNNRERVAGLLWNCCNKAMQSKIENRSEYESKTKGNPIEMLKAIKQHALSFQET